MATDDVLIVGGGVIGLSIAYRLAREGVIATILDRGKIGGEASWAGAGLIPAHTERLHKNPTVELRSWSALLHAEWAVALLEETGVDNGFRRGGGVDVALTADEDQELKANAGRWRNEGIVFERLAEVDFQKVEPALSRELLSVYFLPDRAQIRNPWHLRALEAALLKRGVNVRPAEEVRGFLSRGDRVVGVETGDGLIECGQVVIAAGAWSGDLLTHLKVNAPTPPLKGQIVLLRSPRNLLKRIVEHGKNYHVPRDDGRLLIGATEEQSGFDKRPTPVGMSYLLDEAIRICPVLAEAEVEKSWAGLRPGSFDTKPYLGKLPGFANAFIATGHKRAGIQLSTGTAEVITDLVLGREPRVDLTPFRVDREPTEGEPEAFRS